MRRLTRVDLMLALTMVIWAFNITVTRYVLTHGFRPLAYGSIRYTAAALLAAGVALGLERSLAFAIVGPLFLTTCSGSPRSTTSGPHGRRCSRTSSRSSPPCSRT
jgi:drug/metabolite transporter (DMT)-like permease